MVPAGISAVTGRRQGACSSGLPDPVHKGLRELLGSLDGHHLQTVTEKPVASAIVFDDISRHEHILPPGRSFLILSLRIPGPGSTRR